MKCSEGSNDPGKVTGTARYRERVYSPEMLVKIARFGISQPRVLFNAWWLPRQGVELGDCSWIPGRIDLSLACRSSLSIGDRVFIPRTIEVMGYDDGRIVVGDDVCMDTGARLHVANEATLRIGDRVGVGPYNFLNAFDDLTIGDDTMLAPMISINCADHGVSRGCPMREQRGTYAPVIIGADCWLGAGVVVLKGVTIGNGTMIGAGAVVTDDVPEYTIAAGVPAKVIRERT